MKLARPLCGGADRSTAAAARVKAVVRLAKRYGLTVVAKGVERGEQRLALAAIGCDLAEGRHFARPLPAEEAASALPPTPDGAAGHRPHAVAITGAGALPAPSGLRRGASRP